jgi:hypothetical protein
LSDNPFYVNLTSLSIAPSNYWQENVICPADRRRLSRCWGRASSEHPVTDYKRNWREASPINRHNP